MAFECAERGMGSVGDLGLKIKIKKPKIKVKLPKSVSNVIKYATLPVTASVIGLATIAGKGSKVGKQLGFKGKELKMIKNIMPKVLGAAAVVATAGAAGAFAPAAGAAVVPAAVVGTPVVAGGGLLATATTGITTAGAVAGTAMTVKSLLTKPPSQGGLTPEEEALAAEVGRRTMEDPDAVTNKGGVSPLVIGGVGIAAVLGVLLSLKS